MPPKRAAAKANGVAAKKPRANKAFSLAAPVPVGEVLRDNNKKRWSIGKPVGTGGFGLLYLGSKENESDDQYVIKVEPHANGPLFCELNFYVRVCKPELISKWKSQQKLKFLGVPTYIASGAHERNGTKYRFMVMERFGCDLQKIFERNGKRFPLKTVLQLALRILDALEYIHDNSYVHADIKASNILLGYTPGTTQQVFLVDYGLAFRYCNDSGKHKEYKEDPRRTHDGTIEFTSTDAHRGVVPARRGDLEILGYCLLQWLCGDLPWEDNLNNKDYVATQKFKFAKDIPGLMDACFPNGDGPDVLRDYMKYVMKLQYDERPNYNNLRKSFRVALKKRSLSDDENICFEVAMDAAKPKKLPKALSTATKRPQAKRTPAKVPQLKGTPAKEPQPKGTPAKKICRKRFGSSSSEDVSPLKRMKSTPVKRAASPDTTPKKRTIPFPPVGSWSPRVKTKISTIRSKTKAKCSRVARIIKEKASVATQTSPGLKGLRRSRKK